MGKHMEIVQMIRFHNSKRTVKQYDLGAQPCPTRKLGKL